jgi:HD-GYP domain-containing protein (c-di-GMP phosphodiesterase class II)
MGLRQAHAPAPAGQEVREGPSRGAQQLHVAGNGGAMSVTQPQSRAALPSNGPAVVNLGADDRCRQLLVRAVDVLGGADGAIIAAGGGGVLEPIAAYGDPNAWGKGPLKDAVRAALVASRPTDGIVAASSSRPASGTPERYFAAPLNIDGELIGLLMVTGTASEGASIGARLERLGPLLETITLSVERLRMLAALDKRSDDISALRQQLDAFAVDFRSMYQAERDRSQQLAGALGELERTYRATVAGLAMAVEAKDECTGGHLFRVSRYGMLLTGIVSPEHAGDPQFEFGFLLHDVGKLMVPDEVLNKPGALTDAEWEVMRAHPGNGRSILEGIDFLQGAREIVFSHHERWDGNGYPQGLRDMEIPLGARIFPLCDAFDAMTSDRPYRRALTLHKALDEVCNGDGTQFWSEAVDAFMSIPRDSLQNVMRERRRGPS